MTLSLPRVVDVDAFAAAQTGPRVRLIDLSTTPVYAEQHIPGALHLEYTRLVRRAPPVLGLVPTPGDLAAILGEAGIDPEHHVVAYDEEGGGRASRLLWTLDLVGHRGGASLLDGGLAAWTTQGHPGEATQHSAPLSRYPVQMHHTVEADKDYILARIGASGTVIVDARSPAEYIGATVRAARGGHIPGAVNVEWTEALDGSPQRRLRSLAELVSLYTQRGVTPDKEVIVYCHSHHRSAHSYWVLTHLGFPRVRAYSGSWSEWGNDPTLPVEVST